ncbi:hypothetical protein DFH28DRAFT_955772 [Melampsora americana]|nr:hypothetical protein DFH28DRAFT_955772 [Melampsora americana]
MFGNYIRSMPTLNGSESKNKNKSNSKSNSNVMPKHSKGESGAGKATSATRCQKCEKFGHFTYNCTITTAPYKSRPTRTQQLINPKVKREQPTIEVPEEFLSKKGIADKILEKKEKERKAFENGSVSLNQDQKKIKDRNEFVILMSSKF